VPVLRGGALVKRSPMPPRAVPLRARTPLRATLWRPRRGTRAEALSEHAVRELIWSRCGGNCEACGWPLPIPEVADEPWRGPWDAHHAQLRSQGGHDRPSNRRALHKPCHTISPSSVHENPLEAHDWGLTVWQWEDPAQAVLVLPDGRRVRLDDGDEYLEAT